MINFTNEQVLDIVSKYRQGLSLKEIARPYGVSRPTIQRVVVANCPEYTGKKRKSELFATEETTKKCPVCGRELPLSFFNKGNGKYGKCSRCRECESNIQNDPKRRERRNFLRKQRRANSSYVEHCNERDRITRHTNIDSAKRAMLRSAKRRAKLKGMEFNITIDDIELPEVCPLLGIPLSIEYKQASGNSYSLDRIDSTKGYIKGNVWVISYRANMIKNNATLEELETLVSNLKSVLVH